MKTLVLIGLLFCFIQPIFGKSNLQEKAVRDIVESLCKAEFDGDVYELRKDLVIFTLWEKTKKNKHERDFNSVVYEWDWYEMDVVTSYAISKVEIGEKEAKVTIIYDKIAEQKGKGIINPVSPTKIESVMTVIETQNGLRVLNPPVIKVSKDAVEKYYIYEYFASQKIRFEESRKFGIQRSKSNLEAIGSSVPLGENKEK